VYYQYAELNRKVGSVVELLAKTIFEQEAKPTLGEPTVLPHSRLSSN